jgi:ribosomal protein S1
MVSTNTYAPSREDFAALLDESYGQNEAFEGSVVKGLVVAIEKDVAVIDLGLKTESRVALKEFHGAPGPSPSSSAITYFKSVLADRAQATTKARSKPW